ncbi:hypothetical protein FQR65_LT15170 [Abscondita terminalis]|nr:hypothetical protein FQR65_LT15170 [Abscondita terminalis]
MTKIVADNYPQSGKLIVFIVPAKVVLCGAAILALQKGFEVLVSDKGVIAEKYRQQLEDAGITSPLPKIPASNWRTPVLTYESGQSSEELLLNADACSEESRYSGDSALGSCIKAKRNSGYR